MHLNILSAKCQPFCSGLNAIDVYSNLPGEYGTNREPRHERTTTLDCCTCSYMWWCGGGQIPRPHHIYLWSGPATEVGWRWHSDGTLERGKEDIAGLMQERHNSSALAMEWRLSCINPSIDSWSSSQSNDVLYRKPHCGDKMGIGACCLHGRISYTGTCGNKASL